MIFAEGRAENTVAQSAKNPKVVEEKTEQPEVQGDDVWNQLKNFAG